MIAGPPVAVAGRPGPNGEAAGLVRSALIGLASAMSLVAMGIQRALALDLSSDEGLITDTVASRDRKRVWDPLRREAGALTVAERDRRPFVPDGVRVGNFDVFSTLGAAVVFDDNIFGSDLNKQKDIRSEVAPEIRVLSRLPRHEIDLSLGGKIVSYLDHPEQGYENVHGQLRGALHFDHAHTLSAEVMSAIEHEERADSLATKFAAEPVEIFHNRAQVGITRDVGRLYGTLSAGAESWSYSNVKATDGSIINEGVRDLTVFNGQAKIGYRFSPGYELVTKLRVSRQFNEGDGTISRDGWGYEALAGLAFEPSALFRFHVLGGYGLRQYDQAGLADVTSSLAEAQVAWLATKQLTFYATAKRAIIDEITADTNGGRVETSLAARLEYEVWHNVVFNAGLKLSEADFSAVHRTDRKYSAGAGVDWHLSKNWLFTIAYQHEVRDSTDDAFDMTRNRITVGAKLRF